MRKELLGPLPIVVGILLIIAAFALAARPPPPPCDCPVYTPAEFEALDRAGYAGIAAGSQLVIDGRVAEIRPSELLNYPYRLVRFEGSALSFNVTGYNPNTGPVGEWSRIEAVHQGESETAGAPHHWQHLGKTAPVGGQTVSLAGLALGISVLAWGVATRRRFAETRTLERSLKERLRADRDALESDPAARSAVALQESLSQASGMTRWGQFEAARATLDEVEVQLSRAKRLGERIGEAQRATERAHPRGFNAAAVDAVLDEAELERAAGDVPAAEGFVAWAELNLRELARASELLAICRSSVAANRAAGVEDEAAASHAARAQALFDDGFAAAAAVAATQSIDRSREVSPAAQAAAQEIAALEETLRTNPSADRSREVRDRVRDAQVSYHLGQFEQSRAEARVGRWLADPSALPHGGFRAIAEGDLLARGYRLAKDRTGDPGFGFLMDAGGERVVVVTSAWREFPSERVLLAAKDFINAGGAARALVYSSVFTDTSTDPRIEVQGVKPLVEMLLKAARAEIASGH